MNLLIAPYLLYIKLGLAALILSVVFWGGCSVQKSRDEAQIERLKGSLQTAHYVLNQAKAVLDDVTARSKQRRVEFKTMLVRAEKSTEAAERAEERLKRERRAFDSRLAKAKREPDCATLLRTDVAALCAL
jgi:hypothetical protein